jgi:hypothetical protein
MAANNCNIWRGPDLDNAIRDALDIGLYLPAEWRRLSGFARLFPRLTNWRTVPRENCEAFSEIVEGALRSRDLALVWSGWFVVAETFHRIQGILDYSGGPAHRLLNQVKARPALLSGAHFECGLIWLGVQSLKSSLSERSGPPQLAAVLQESYGALDFFRYFQPDWHPGQPIGLNPYVDAKQELLRQLTSDRIWRLRPASVIAAEFDLAPYLNLLYDVSFHLGSRLPPAAKEDESAPMETKRKALELSGLWGVSAWEAYQGRRRWEEELKRRQANRKGHAMAPTSIQESEVLALELAIKGFWAAGWEHRAAALASVLTSYVLMERPFRLKGRRDASPDEHKAYFRKIRTKYSQLINQLGFEVVGGGGDDRILAEIRPRATPWYEPLYERVAHSGKGQGRDWLRLLDLIQELPSLRDRATGGRKLPLFHLVYNTLVPRGPYRPPHTSDLPPPELLRPELEPIRQQVIPVMFRLCLRQWRLRWMVGLLTLDSSGLNSDHLAQFFRHWKCALGLAPEFISFQTEFHQGARDALSRYAIGLDENDYFEALELLHSSVLTLLDDRHCSADELFDRWTEHNLHTLVLGTGFDKRRLGLTTKASNGIKYGSRVRIPSLQKLSSVLSDIGYRTGRKVLWVSFVEAGTEENPELRGLTLNSTHTMRRWMEDLQPGSTLEGETKSYVKNLGIAMLYGKPPVPLDVRKNSSLEKLLDKILMQIMENPGVGDILLLSGPPGLNSLPWRWLLQSRASSAGVTPPLVFIVPSATWLVSRDEPLTGRPVTIREGHGSVTETEAKRSFDDLRKLCGTPEVVVDNTCFSGRTDRWRACEWKGNPTILLLTPCRLLVAPPCEIPRSTADKLKHSLRAKEQSGARMDPLAVVAELDSISAESPPAWIYNLYGAP